MNNKSGGKTRLEILLVMLLLIMFGISTYTLVLATATSYEKTQNENVAKDSLRLASSYLDSRIRQMGEKSIKTDELFGEGKNIVFEENIDGTIYQTVIYHKGNTLREVFMEKGTKLEDDTGFEIAQIEEFQVNYKKNKILELYFSTKANGKNYSTQTFVNLGKGV